MCQSASLVPLSCSPGPTSSRCSFFNFPTFLLAEGGGVLLHFFFPAHKMASLFTLTASLLSQGDPALVEAFEGLEPQQDKHQFQIDILPVSCSNHFLVELLLLAQKMVFFNFFSCPENGSWDESSGSFTDQPCDEKVPPPPDPLFSSLSSSS